MRKAKDTWRIGLVSFVFAACACVALTIGVRLFVVASTAAYRDLPARGYAHPVALVFGAGLNPDGTPSGMLADRLDAAIALYHQRRVNHLLLSGDNGSVYYNEVAAMQRYARAHGVPQRAITLDYAGFNTYASCYRARVIFGVRSAVLLTQNYHLPRALFLCRHLGIEATGIGTPDWGREPNSMMTRFTVREYLATLRAVWEANVTHPKPKYLGRYEGLH